MAQISEEKELGDLFSKIGFDKVSKTLTNYNINWKLIPPLSPWMGIAWESIVKSTKKTLRIVTHDRPLYEILYRRLLPTLNQY